MHVHELTLAAAPFEAIEGGRKTIECRLHDEKRQRIRLGDELIFTNREDPARKMRVRVTGLLHYATFEALFSSADPEKFGGRSKEELLDLVRQFYPTSEEERYGVLGIVIDRP